MIDTPMFLGVPIKGIYISPQKTLESIKAFRHGLEAGLMALAGQAAQIATSYGLGCLFRLLNRVWEPLGSILEKVVLLFGDYIPASASCCDGCGCRPVRSDECFAVWMEGEAQGWPVSG